MLAFSEVTLSFRNEREEKKFPGLQRVWDYLAERGVDRATADACGLHVMQAVELIAAARRSANVNSVDNRAAVIFPHWKLGQAEPIEWWSARLVPLAPQAELRVVASFGDLVDQGQSVIGKLGKMFCPPNEAPHAYMPPVYPWAGLRDDDKVYIHESCIKAINGAVLGYASVGLNGVWGWTSRKHTIALVEELRDLPWKAKRLQPVIVFDSNAWDNWQVQRAEASLAAKLLEITGRRAVALRVPKWQGEDQGFDDYRARVGDAAARSFLDGGSAEGGFTEIELSDIQLLMLQLSSEVCVVRELGRIADQATGDLMSRAVFTDVNYAHFTAEIEDGERTRQVNVPKLWLSDPRRVEVQSLEYSPGRDRLIRGPGGLPNLNLWRGMGCEPEPGDVDPWLELLANNVMDDGLRQWIINWCAYPVQHLGAKMNTMLLMFGPSGTGKDLFLTPVKAMYGGNAVEVDSDALKSSFTSFYAQRQLVHANELVRCKGEEDAINQRVKALVTSPKLKVNRKGQPEYEIDNHVNVAITSNYWDCIKLDQDDRRACVVRWDGEMDRRGDQPYWSRYVRWVECGGAAAVHDYLLRRDTTGFDPAAWAPDTKWKEQVKEATMGALESWVMDLMRTPAEVLPIIGVGRALWTAKELAVLYYGEGENELSPGKVKAIANCLRNVGFTQAHGGALIRRPGGVADRFWVIQQKNRTWTGADATAHFKTGG
jgi:hypothetical protein